VDGGQSPSGSGTMGSLSPVTSSHSNASPLNYKKSSFSGDKRSYEVVTAVMEQLAADRASGFVRSLAGCCSIEQKCSLLVSMLHHQLKEVASRTADPSKSEVISRDLGSMRLTQDKMEKLLGQLQDCYRDLIYTPSVVQGGSAHGDSGVKSIGEATAALVRQDNEQVESLKHSIALKLFTAMLQLLNSIFLFNSADDAQSTLSQRRRAIFEFAVTALRKLTDTYGVDVFSCNSSTSSAAHKQQQQHYSASGYSSESKENSSSSSSGGNSGSSSNGVSRHRKITTAQALAHVCLHILKLSVPRGGAESLVSLTDHAAWKELLATSRAAQLLTQVVQQLSAATASLPLWCHQYTHWAEGSFAVCTAEDAAPSEAAAHRFGASVARIRMQGAVVANHFQYEQGMAMLASLIGTLDAAIGGLCANVITIHSSGASISGLLAALTTSPLLQNYRKVLTEQSTHKAAVAMGYNSATCEESPLATVWVRAINLVESVIVKLAPEAAGGMQPQQAAGVVEGLGSDPASAAALELGQCVVAFLRMYSDVLLLPLRSDLTAVRVSVQQLALMRATLSLFATANANFPLWKSMLPALHKEVVARSVSTLRIFSLLLWHGEDMSSPEQQRRMLGASVAVSEKERRTGRNAASASATGASAGASSSNAAGTLLIRYIFVAAFVFRPLF
jgi:hypothetical protein